MKLKRSKKIKSKLLPELNRFEKRVEEITELL